MGSKTIFSHSIKVKEELKEFFNWYNNMKLKNSNPVLLSVLVHIKFVSIHPFSDGNGRVSRLLSNFVLYKNQYPLIDIPYIKRKSYYNNLEKSQTKNDESYFVNFLTKKYIEENI